MGYDYLSIVSGRPLENECGSETAQLTMNECGKWEVNEEDFNGDLLNDMI